MKILNDEQGQVLVLTALAMTLLLCFLALAIDVGQLYYTQRQLQTAADAAALSGALESSQCGATSNCLAMQQAAQAALVENGISGATLYTQCAATKGTGTELTLNNGPCALGSADPNYKNTGYIEAVASRQTPTFFASLMGFKSVDVTARSEAALGPPQFCLDVLNPTASQAMLMNGNSSLDAHCGVIVDSSSGTALLANGHVTLTASAINVHGQDLLNGNPSVSPTPQLNAPTQPDPLANTPVPQSSGCGATTTSPYTGSPHQVTVNGGGQAAVFNPGTYCGGITLNGNASGSFNPGTYIIQGPMVVNGGDTITGNGVTFYFATSSLTMNGNTHADLVAPTTGTYAGILIFQSPTDSTSLILNGDTTSVWQGAIYVPDAQLTLNGGANLAAYTILDVNTLVVNGNDTFTLGKDYSSLPGGPPIKGTSAYLME
jgi:Flp pilus assembly protein TadG